MGKYKYAIKKELQWLDEELAILNNIIKTQAYTKEYSFENIEDVKSIIQFEKIRLKKWMSEAREKNEYQKEHNPKVQKECNEGRDCNKRRGA